MLRNYYKCNKIVTNGDSGTKNYIVKSGHQIVHALTGAGARHRTGATVRLGYIYTSWKAGSWNKLEAGSWQDHAHKRAGSCN